jgi:hypothetical protein
LLEQVQDAGALRRRLYRSLARNLASCAQRVVVGGCWRWPHTFARLPLDTKRQIRNEVAVEFRDKE